MSTKGKSVPALLQRLFSMTSTMKPNRPGAAKSSTPATKVRGRAKAAVVVFVAVVLIVTVTLVWVLPAAMLEGLNAQVVAAGSPEHAKVSGEVIAGVGLNVTCSVTDFPAVTLTEGSMGARVKAGFSTVTAFRWLGSPRPAYW